MVLAKLVLNENRYIYTSERLRLKRRKTPGLQRSKRRKILGEVEYLVRGGEEERGRKREKQYLGEGK